MMVAMTLAVAGVALLPLCSTHWIGLLLLSIDSSADGISLKRTSRYHHHPCDDITSRLRRGQEGRISWETKVHMMASSPEIDVTSNESHRRIPKDSRASQNRSSSRVHLLSLQWPSEDDDNSNMDGYDYYSRSAVRALWLWKDACLGDGRDFFVPKPRTLSALNRYLMDRIPQDVTECSVISNCARFEIVLTQQTLTNGIDEDDNDAALKSAVSGALAAQVHSNSRSSPHGPAAYGMWKEQLRRGFDRPEVIDWNANDDDDSAPASYCWNHLQGVECVSRHLNTIASGMAERPSRPGRPVPFRPFSSRDAHVLLQLKRIAEIAEGPRIRALLNTALQAGKLARNPHRIPELEPLRRFGSGGGRYSQEPPRALSEAAASAVEELAIETNVRRCIDKFQAMDHTETIACLRRDIQRLAKTDEERKVVQKLLHQPTLEVRAGELVDTDKVRQRIDIHLQKMRAG